MIRKQTEAKKKKKRLEKKEKKEKTKIEDIDLGRFFELATTDKLHFNGLNWHEIEDDIRIGYTGDFEMIVSMLIREIEQKSNIRFKNFDDFEIYNNAIDCDYDAGVVVFAGWLRKLNTPQFIMVNRSQYDRETAFKQDIVEYIVIICDIPTSGNCFTKHMNHLSFRDYMKDFSTFIRD